MTKRLKAMGFWDYPARGISTPSKAWMEALLAAQRAGKEVDDVSRQRLDAGKVTKQYPLDEYPGHAAWLDWPWKLHRIENDKGVKFELYNLAEDPMESKDVASEQARRVRSMQSQLQRWQKSVVQSLNGEEYYI
jgi:hypothetical protein